MSDSGPPYGGDSPDMRMDVDIDPQKTKEKALWMVGLDLLSPTARRRSLAAIGVGALVLAVLLVAAPWLPVWLAGPFLPLLVVAQAGKAGIVFLGLVGAAVGLLSLYGKTSPGKPSGSGIDVPDRPRDREIRRTAEPPGNRLNSLVNRVSGDAENPSRGVNRSVDRRQIRKQLRNAAADVLADTNDLSRNEALARIEEGTWTDSRRAAGFLGNSDAPRPRLSTRIRDWASGDPFVRQVDATVDEIADSADLDTDGELLDAPPDRIERPRPGYGHVPDPSDETDPKLDLDAPGSSGPAIDAPESDGEGTGPPETDDSPGDDEAAPGNEEGDAVSSGEGENASSPGSDDDPDGGGRDGDPDDRGVPEGWISPGSQDGDVPAGDGSGSADEPEARAESERPNGSESP